MTICFVELSFLRIAILILPVTSTTPIFTACSVILKSTMTVWFAFTWMTFSTVAYPIILVAKV